MRSRSHMVRWFGSLAFGLLFFGALYLSSLYSYLLFHSLAESFSVVIASSIFALAWNARRFMANDYLLALATGYLFVAALTLVHTLAYRGMGVFPDDGGNLATQLWLASRYTLALVLILSLRYLDRRLHQPALLLFYAALTALWLVAIFLWPAFPDAYVVGSGLTRFKIDSEYVISLLFVAAIAILWLNRAAFDPVVLRLNCLSILAAIGSELAFTSYVGVYDAANLAGHLFNVLSAYLIYRAIIEIGLRRPYDLLFRELKQREAALRQARDELEQRVQERTAELLQREASLREANMTLQRLSRRLADVQENERRAMARELHDEAGQSLTALKIELGLLSEAVGPEPDVQEGVGRLKQLVDSLADGLHRLATSLRPVALDRSGLVPALKQYVEAFSRQTNLAISFTSTGPADCRLPVSVESTLYRVVQEALTNVARHARARNVGVVLHWDGPAAQYVQVIVEDDGVGFDVEHALQSGRLGVAGMLERAELLGGNVKIESRPGAGTALFVRVPLTGHDGREPA